MYRLQFKIFETSHTKLDINLQIYDRTGSYLFLSIQKREKHFLDKNHKDINLKLFSNI